MRVGKILLWMVSILCADTLDVRHHDFVSHGSVELWSPATEVSGTRSVVVMLPEERSHLALRLPPAAKVYHIQVNGQDFPVVGKDWKVLISDLDPAMGGVLHVLQKFEDEGTEFGGPWQSISLGDTVSMNANEHFWESLRCLIAGLLFLIAMYHLVLFVYYQSRQENLLFTLMSLVGAFRLLSPGDHFLCQLFPSVPWSLWIRLDFISVGIGFSLIYLYVNRIYPKMMMHSVGRWGLGLGLGHAFACAWMPLSWLSPSLIVAELGLAVQCVVIYMAIIRTLNMRKADFSAIAMLVSMSILVGTVIFDFLTFQGLIRSSHFYAAYGFVPLLLLQWLSMARGYGIAYSVAEHQLDAFLHSMAKAIVSKSRFTGDHVERVACISERICSALFLPDNQARQIRLGAIVHDLGKLHIPDELLDKPGELTEDEVRQIQEHPLHGVRILERVDGLDIPRTIIRNHHENWDGTGYPDRLRGENIPLGARIVAVADFWDAITSIRAHRDAMSSEQARELLRLQAGKRLDPDLVDLFLAKRLWS